MAVPLREDWVLAAVEVRQALVGLDPDQGAVHLLGDAKVEAKSVL
jgi:hypothetical protein